MSLRQKVTAEESPNTRNAQRPARMTPDDHSIKSHAVMTLPEWRVRHQSLRGMTPPTPLPSSATAKMLVALDVFCLLLVSIPTLLCESGYVAPHFQGFFCDDNTIKYPRVSHYAIEDSALITMDFLLSIFMISLGEMIRVRSLQLSSPALLNSTYMVMVYKHLGTFVFGGMASYSLANIAKMTTGSLRPHFLAVCQPDPTSFKCESGYITNYSCTGHPADILNARKSFYSEHASFGMYCMVYLMARYWGQKTKLLRPTIQFLFLSLALLTGYIQTLDHWHHPYDMVFGFLLGALMAFWVAFYISGLSLYRAMPGPSSPGH